MITRFCIQGWKKWPSFAKNKMYHTLWTMPMGYSRPSACIWFNRYSLSVHILLRQRCTLKYGRVYNQLFEWKLILFCYEVVHGFNPLVQISFLQFWYFRLYLLTVHYVLVGVCKNTPGIKMVSNFTIQIKPLWLNICIINSDFATK